MARQRITTLDKKLALDDDDQKLVDAGVASGDRLEIKDLGPQIGMLSLFLYDSHAHTDRVQPRCSVEDGRKLADPDPH